jgi:hypothetical protein
MPSPLHKTQILVGANNSSFPISKDAWNARHFGNPTDPQTLPFPHIGAWWPSAQTPAAIAAFADYVIHPEDDYADVAEIKAANPDVIILTTIDATSLVATRSSPGYNHALNVELRSISSDWMLTKFGTTLTGTLDATSQVDVTVADGTKLDLATTEYNGLVLIGGLGDTPSDRTTELARVTGIAGNTITLTRGEFWPKMAHSSGVRIATVASIYPGTVLFDQTPNCPSVDVGDGPQTWTDWNAARALTRIAAADYDGVFADVCGYHRSGDYSNTARTVIDYARSNSGTPVYATDANLNSAVAIGVDSLIAQVQGAGFMIVGNDKPHSHLIDGVTFENAPTATWTVATFQTNVPGPYTDSKYVNTRAGYLHGGPSNYNGKYTLFEARATTNQNGTLPTDATNLALMRFGLAVTLMGDGFFTFTDYDDHSEAGLWEFDEYTNVGVGRGYLGLALGKFYDAENAGGYSLNTRVARRDFQNGIALANFDAVGQTARTVNLGGSFRKLDGTQDATVNDGSLVTSVTLAPHDGIILLRTEPSAGVSAVEDLIDHVEALEGVTARGAVQIPTSDPYAQMAANQPAAWHFRGLHDRTYFTYLGRAGNYFVNYYDHDTHSWGTEFDFGPIYSDPDEFGGAPNGDGHAAPVLGIDTAGYISRH